MLPPAAFSAFTLGMKRSIAFTTRVITRFAAGARRKADSSFHEFPSVTIYLFFKFIEQHWRPRYFGLRFLREACNWIRVHAEQ